MRKNINSVTITGRIFEHDLALKTVQNLQSENFGKEFINGTLHLAVDDEGLNVIPVSYTYVTATTKSGNTNATFYVLKKIIDEDRTWSKVGKDQAMIVKADTSIGVNDFYGRDNNLISAQRAEGGFVSEVSSMPEDSSGKLNDFTVDMVITKVTRIEPDPEKNIDEEYMTIRGAAFNFRNDLLPIELTLRNPKGMDYFESAEISSKSPLYTKVWGRVNCTTVKTKVVEESAWGNAKVTYSEKKRREWLLTGLKCVPYEFGEEGVLTVEELVKAQQDREIHLADVKKRSDEYQMSKAAKATSPASFAAAAQTIPAGQFNF